MASLGGSTSVPRDERELCRALQSYRPISRYQPTGAIVLQNENVIVLGRSDCGRPALQRVFLAAQISVVEGWAEFLASERERGRRPWWYVQPHSPYLIEGRVIIERVLELRVDGGLMLVVLFSVFEDSWRDVVDEKNLFRFHLVRGTIVGAGVHVGSLVDKRRLRGDRRLMCGTIQLHPSELLRQDNDTQWSLINVITTLEHEHGLFALSAAWVSSSCWSAERVIATHASETHEAVCVTLNGSMKVFPFMYVAKLTLYADAFAGQLASGVGEVSDSWGSNFFAAQPIGSVDVAWRVSTWTLALSHMLTRDEDGNDVETLMDALSELV